MILNLIALHREPRVVAAVVAGDVIVFQPKNVERQPETQIFVAVERQAGRFEALRLCDVRGLLDSRCDIGTDVTDGHAAHRSDKRQLHQIGSQSRALHHVMIIRSGKISDSQSVLLGRLAQEIDPGHSAGSGHVLHDHRRVAGDMPGQMTSDDSPFDIRRPARREVDKEGNILSLVKRRLRGEGKVDKRDRSEDQNQGNSAMELHDRFSFHFRNSWAAGIVSATIVSLNLTLLTLPTSVCGSDERNSTDFGTLYADSRSLQKWSNSFALRSASGLSTITALTASPHCASGTPITAASKTA